MSSTTDILIDLERLRQQNSKLLDENAGLRREPLSRNSRAAILRGHCAVCEYVPNDLKPNPQPATDRFHNGG